MSRVKIAEKTVFLFYFQSFFELWAKIIQTFGQKTSRICQNYLLRVQRKNLWLFFKFWNVSDFLQKHLAWFPIFYLRVQSKNCGKNRFFMFSFQNFFEFWAKNFSDFRPKNFKKFSKLPTCPEEKFVTWFFLSFQTFRIFCRNIWHGSQNSIYVSRVKIAEKTVFFVFFPEFFRILSKNFPDFWPKNIKKISKLPTCPEEKFVTWNFFLKFWIVLDFLQKPSAWFSNFYLRVQSKNCGKNSFFVLFSEFFRIMSENFSDFWPKNFKKIVKTTYASGGKVCDLIFFKFSNVSDFLQKHLAWISKFYLRVQSKNCGKNRFFMFSFQNFFEFWAKNFSDFWPKNFKKISKLPTCPEEKFVTWIFFLKYWIVLDFLREPSAWFSNFYLRVKSKNCGKNSFFCFLSRFFSNFEQKLFRLLAKKHQKDFKTIFVSRGKVCDFKFFSKVLNRFGFSAETFGMVLNFLSTCQE